MRKRRTGYSRFPILNYRKRSSIAGTAYNTKLQ